MVLGALQYPVHVTDLLGVLFLAVVILWSLNQGLPIYHQEVPQAVLLVAIDLHTHHIESLLREGAPEGATVAVGVVEAEAPYHQL